MTQLRHALLDMDGTIYEGRRLFEATPRFLASLERRGIGFTFLTNNSSKNRHEYVERLGTMGLSIDLERIHTSIEATLDLIAHRYPATRRVYALVAPGFSDALRSAGYEVVRDDEEPDLVVVGFDTTLTYERLCKCAFWVRAGKPYVASHPDRICPTDLATVLVDCGAICAAIEHAVGRAPDAVAGKPDPGMVEGLFRRHGLVPGEVVMIGDRLHTDMELAWRVGCRSALVLTGDTSRAHLDAHARRPDFVAEDLDELEGMLFPNA
ncbi:MAG: HAD-IIA family hydrolase [Planctomycetes bacterium]|nr:HAD-IIA family hydrolase [Planctomycetota bacterium]MCB9892234.1 HAD-IIA family hydrolase [Planctomycetota bacterium]